MDDCERARTAGEAREIKLNDHQNAAEFARRAGELLVQIRAEGKQAGARGDRESHEFLVDAIRSSYPDDAILSEEAADDHTRLDAERVWIIDPLDGTREYGEVPRDDWAVHVALWVRGDIAAAAVALPARGVVLSTASPPPTPQPHDGPVRLVVSRTRPPALAQHVADTLGAELVPMGSAGAKMASVVLGESDAYVHGGGQYEWDNAAPVGVARAAGLHASRLDGSALVYNQPDPKLPDLVVCRADLADALLDAIAKSDAQSRYTS